MRYRRFCPGPTFLGNIASDIGQSNSENGNIVPEVKVICSFKQREFT